MVATFELLQRIPLLSVAKPSSLKQLADATHVRTYDRGDWVLRTGSSANHVLALVSGAIEIRKKNREAGTEMLSGVMEAPSVMGDAQFYGRRDKWGHSLRAANETTIGWMPHRSFDKFIDEDGKAAAALYRDACARHMISIDIRHMLTTETLRSKLIRLLFSASQKSADEKTVEVRQVRQTELARAVGVHPRSIARQLQQLEEEGVLLKLPRGQGFRLSIDPKQVFENALDKRGSQASWRLYPNRNS